MLKIFVLIMKEIMTVTKISQELMQYFLQKTIFKMLINYGSTE